MNKIQYFSFLFSLMVISLSLKAQTPDENQKKYLYGKELFKEGRYDAAAQVFLPLTAEASHNAFSKPASYFYALSSLKSGDLEAAKSMCLQMLQRYEDWDQKDNVYYLLANTYFEQNKPRLAIQFLNKISGLKKDSESMKTYYFNKISPLDTLKSIQKDYPAEQELAVILAKKLSVTYLDEQTKMLLNFLIQEYKLNSDELYKKKVSILKKSYNVALFLPFQLNDIDPKVSKRSNQYILDFYEGVRMALDTLKSKGININVYTYDTEKDVTIVNSILSLPELKQMDMIIGPVFPNQMQVVSEFSKRNNIINVSPFSANSKNFENNEFCFLFQPTLEIMAGTAIRYAAENFKHDSMFVYNYEPPRGKFRFRDKEVKEHKNVMIFYGADLKDSLIAVYYRDSCKANKLEVTHFEKITRPKLDLLRTILADSTRLGMCNHVFASTSDEVVAANIISLMDVSRQATPLITRSDWLAFNLISFEQFEKRNVFFIHPDYFDYGNPFYRSFKTSYVDRTQIYPSLHSMQGYELMTYFANALNQYGTYYKYGLDEAGFTKGTIFQGFDFSNSYSNKYVPFTRFKEKNLILVNRKY
jgi:tetratricopeptide (TPR) repeat protein